MLRWGLAIAAMLLAVLLVDVSVPGDVQALQETKKSRADTQRPNIVFVSTNDQDAASLEQMAYAGGEFQAGAKTYPNHTFAYPVCCPSRVTWLRGQYPHNHTVWTNLAEANGGYQRFKSQGYDKANLATRLNGNGYRTGMFGYYVNQTPYDGSEPGWNAFVGPGKTYTGAPAGTTNHGTRDRIISNNALRFARENAGGNKPLFQWVSYYGPHYPFDSEPRFADAARCDNLGLPPSPAIDEDTDEELADKPAFVRELARINSGYTDAKIAQDYENRCRALQTPDEGLQRLVAQYRARGELSETYFVFGTDNGYMLGEHGLKAKQYPYVESARFPLIVRGPGVAAGTDDRMVSNVDIMPTFLDIAGASVPGYVDGESMLPAWKGNPSATVRDSALVEGRRIDGGAPDYSGLVDENWTYTEWADGSREYYDLGADPYQLENAYDGLSEERRVELEARLRAQKDCAGEECRTPGITVP